MCARTIDDDDNTTTSSSRWFRNKVVVALENDRTKISSNKNGTRIVLREIIDIDGVIVMVNGLFDCYFLFVSSTNPGTAGTITDVKLLLPNANRISFKPWRS